jgi:NADPH-dependent glutamate synthase beta subunit-like oxidoreductase
VAINDLKRFVMDWAHSQDEFPHQPTPGPANGMRVAVVGAGPAGLAAAHDLAMRGYKVDLYDADDEPGGILRSGIPAYRLPTGVLERDVQRIFDLGVSFHGGRRLGADLGIGELLESSDAVLVALGAGADRELRLPGEGPELIPALSYLREDPGPADAVLVVGGGNSAIDSARTAIRRGARSVTIACLEARGEMPAIPTEVAAAEQEGIRILDGVRLRRLIPGGVELERVDALVPGSADPEDYRAVEGSEMSVDVFRVIVAIGQQHPDTGSGEGPLLDWSQGLVVDARTGRTSHDRIFAAGDLTGGRRTAVDAIAGGLRAAWGIDRALRGPAEADKRMPPPLVPTKAPDTRRGVSRVDVEQRHAVPELESARRVAGFDEIVGVLTEEQARAEAARCMICGLCGNCNACLDLFGCPAFYVSGGLIEIDPALCVVCGVCAQFCPNDAIYPVTTTMAFGGPQ